MECCVCRGHVSVPGINCCTAVSAYCLPLTGSAKIRFPHRIFKRDCPFIFPVLVACSTWHRLERSVRVYCSLEIVNGALHPPPNPSRCSGRGLCAAHSAWLAGRGVACGAVHWPNACNAINLKCTMVLRQCSAPPNLLENQGRCRKVHPA